MSALPRKAEFAGTIGMSAKCQKRTFCGAAKYVAIRSLRQRPRAGIGPPTSLAPIVRQTTKRIAAPVYRQAGTEGSTDGKVRLRNVGTGVGFPSLLMVRRKSAFVCRFKHPNHSR